MKCPNGDGELVEARRDGMDVHACAACKGMWLTRLELDVLENEAFHLGDKEKGSLVLGSAPSTRPCPECAKPMRSFSYRLYDLQLEFCEDGHGFWLDAGEDKRVLELMKEEEARVRRSERAQDKWSSLVKHLRSSSFIDRLRDLLR